MVARYFRFTLKGDNIEPEKIRDTVGLPCDIFHKNDIMEKEYLNHPIIQKTNRWVYRNESFSKMRTDTFLYKNLKIIASKMEKINIFLNKATANMELVLYVGNRTDIVLSVRNIELLKKIGIDFSISFC